MAEHEVDDESPVETRRILTPEQYETLLLVRHNMPESLIAEINRQPLRSERMAAPSGSHMKKVLEHVLCLPVAMPPSLGAMQTALEGQAGNLIAAWHELGSGGLLREMLQRLTITEQVYRERFGIDPLAMTRTGATQREMRNLAALEMAAHAADQSARAAHTSAHEAARAAASARFWQIAAVVISLAPWQSARSSKSCRWTD